MVELGFAVGLEGRSIVKFRPWGPLDIKTPINTHRPHGVEIDAHLIVCCIKQLKEAYGWSIDTFGA